MVAEAMDLEHLHRIRMIATAITTIHSGTASKAVPLAVAWDALPPVWELVARATTVATARIPMDPVRQWRLRRPNRRPFIPLPRPNPPPFILFRIAIPATTLRRPEDCHLHHLRRLLRKNNPITNRAMKLPPSPILPADLPGITIFPSRRFTRILPSKGSAAVKTPIIIIITSRSSPVPAVQTFPRAAATRTLSTTTAAVPALAMASKSNPCNGPTTRATRESTPALSTPTSFPMAREEKWNTTEAKSRKESGRTEVCDEVRVTIVIITITVPPPLLPVMQVGMPAANRPLEGTRRPPRRHHHRPTSTETNEEARGNLRNEDPHLPCEVQVA
mmetsp:Transcript_19255/g.40444  ORF Transcript_19255/g.40444 Transcript_19255/m.40444 type:complete len:332 (+) Transcript_19255:2518-3513(+)